ncbi:uncharacterized protein BP5553_00189 [Venustampulla echinocandica]|uniref:Uncharacterized protein n=1 Tax=Venustampulla echinocandica TaxID=2656787 RepID=A0A370TXG7_9HELO|nr:uncharacterized protein BP5553_00189 [Venustampulla echinocandica]RDL40210.1 hypothetical protein BP5553_00189 [Venustampulla echinocandica]
MASIGKLQGALGIVSNENTLALGNLDFDFSRFIAQVPVEFRGLGAVSIQRRADAEGGTYHQTARRLGALFEQVLPSTPRLVRAYGQRYSDISQMPDINPNGSKRYGTFEQQTPDKGTSVWDEIVNRRKAMIKAENSGVESQNWSTLMASQQTISRKELAAWLRRADEATNKEQMRLMLIIKNVSMSVNNISDTYDSVMQAWRISLSAMEKIINGMPQMAQNGAMLLALSAWHIYPDLNILREASKLVSLEDKLVASGGTITIRSRNE